MGWVGLPAEVILAADVAGRTERDDLAIRRILLVPIRVAESVGNLRPLRV